MEKLIKKILKEYVESELNELMTSYHYNKNFFIRFTNNEEFIVKKFTKINNKLDVREVGTYMLSNNERKQIGSTIEKIMSYDLPEDEDFGIEVHRFNIDIERINFYSKDDKYETFKSVLKDEDNTKLYLMDKETQSVGDILFFIVKQNKIITTFFERSFNYPMVKEKRNLTHLITADEVEKYKIEKKEKPFDFKDWSGR